MDAGAQVQLTCPKKRKGSRNVRPRHIQDWKPSAGAQRAEDPSLRPRARGKDTPSRLAQDCRVGGLARLTHGEVHGVPLAQGPQAVQTAALVVILEELHKTWRGRGRASGRGWSPTSLPALPWGASPK